MSEKDAAVLGRASDDRAGEREGGEEGDTWRGGTELLWLWRKGEVTFLGLHCCGCWYSHDITAPDTSSGNSRLHITWREGGKEGGRGGRKGGEGEEREWM